MKHIAKSIVLAVASFAISTGSLFAMEINTIHFLIPGGAGGGSAIAHQEGGGWNHAKTTPETTPGDNPTEVGAPHDLEFERKENSIKFKWNRGATGNRPPGYLIEGRIGNDWVDILNMIGGETRVAIRASEAEGVNAWRVSGANENGRGRAAEEVLVERSITSIAAFG